VSEWWTYTLSDFLLFSPRTYFRLFELNNRAVWPAQVLALACGAAILPLMRGRKPWHGRLLAAILAASWLWIAWAFHLERYAAINWAATWFAAAFAVQAVLLGWTGVVRGSLACRALDQWVARASLAMVAFALFAMPLIAPLTGRSWIQAEVFGIAPDPTAIATLGVLAGAVGRTVWVLMPVPLLWCLITGATHFAMGSPEALVSPIAAVLVVLLGLSRR
jgi:hypothetical protein